MSTRVNYAEPNVKEALYLAELGYSYSFIEQATGLSQNQITYRLQRQEISVRAYRTGQSETAQLVQAHLRRQIMKTISQRVEAHDTAMREQMAKRQKERELKKKADRLLKADDILAGAKKGAKKKKLGAKVKNGRHWERIKEEAVLLLEKSHPHPQHRRLAAQHA